MATDLNTEQHFELLALVARNSGAPDPYDAMLGGKRKNKLSKVRKSKKAKKSQKAKKSRKVRKSRKAKKTRSRK